MSAKALIVAFSATALLSAAPMALLTVATAETIHLPTAVSDPQGDAEAPSSRSLTAKQLRALDIRKVTYSEPKGRYQVRFKLEELQKPPKERAYGYSTGGAVTLPSGKSSSFTMRVVVKRGQEPQVFYSDQSGYRRGATARVSYSTDTVTLSVPKKLLPGEKLKRVRSSTLEASSELLLVDHAQAPDLNLK